MILCFVFKQMIIQYIVSEIWFVCLKAFYFPRMGRNQESADQEQSEEDIPCCNVGVSRAWGPEDPEPRHICPAAKCCGHLSTKVYVDSDLTVYEICVSDVVCSFIYFCDRTPS